MKELGEGRKKRWFRIGRVRRGKRDKGGIEEIHKGRGMRV